MSKHFDCGDKGALVAYLYDDCQAEERVAIAAHVADCADCTAELASLGATRQKLSAWTPPDTVLGFDMEANAAPWALSPGRSRWWSKPLPAWAQAAAAAMIFAAGLSLGAARGAAPTDPPSTRAIRTAAMPAVAPGVSAAELERVEQQVQQLRNEMTQLQATSAPARNGSPVTLARVQTLIAESEQRQQGQLAFRTAQLARDFDAQRRADMERVQGAIGTVQRVTGAEVRQHREAITQINNLLVNASFRP